MGSHAIMRTNSSCRLCLFQEFGLIPAELQSWALAVLNNLHQTEKCATSEQVT